MKTPTIITDTVGMDAHVIGTKILSRAFREAGFTIVELGILTPPEEFIHAAVETNADAILMSSLYGIAVLDVRGASRRSALRPGYRMCRSISAAYLAWAGTTSKKTKSGSRSLDSTGFTRRKRISKAPFRISGST